MRDAEKSLRMKLSDLEKTKAQLQNEIANRDRTINQLKAVSTAKQWITKTTKERNINWHCHVN